MLPTIHRSRFVLLLLALSANVGTRADDDLTVLRPTPDGVAPGEQLSRWLKNKFYEHVDRRSAAFEKMLKSESACRAWQQERRDFFRKQLGEFPARTPLNAQVVGKLQGQDYAVEKLLFQSRPNFHVTANLYLPATAPPWPAVIVPCGHSHDGKAVGQYQRVCILLARHGMAALCYDPIGQGERYQMLDLQRRRDAFEDAPHVKTPHPNCRFMCTTEHTMIGLGSALLGGNVAQFRVWDGMRAIDYLQSRPDILAEKIGCTGNSGGGTETAYLMALDERIVAASPGCYLTTFRRLIDSKGPQDGEQNIFGQIAFGLDEADYCLMRAPRPTLICAGTRDATFDFRGTWELFLDAKRFYSRLGRTDAIDINAPDAPHGFTLQQREAVASWMHRWLLGKEKRIREVESLPDIITDEQLRQYSVGDWTAEQLQCVPAGQVLLLPGERSVFQINAEIAAELRTSRAAAWKRSSDDEKRQRVRDTIVARESGAPAAAGRPAASVTTVGKIERTGYSIHKLVLAVDASLQLPALAFVPAQPNGERVLYLHGQNIAADAAPGGSIEKLARDGNVVLSAELRGIGETETGRGKREFGSGRFGPDNLEILTAYLMGETYVGMRTDDIANWTRAFDAFANGIFKTKARDSLAKPRLIAQGEAAIPALHAAALRPEDYSTVTLREMLPDWETIVRATLTHNQAVNVVHGALRHYDLPDLVPLIGSPRVTIEKPASTF